MPTEKITFQGSDGDELAARLDSPDSKPLAYVLFAHCFTCGKDLSAINRVAKKLNDYGLALFRFDFTGLGKSEGEFANTNFSSNIEDLLSATDHLRNNFQAPKILMGHSLGGTAVLAAAAKIPEVKAVATIGAPFDTDHVLHHFHAHIDEINDEGKAKVDLAGREFTIKKQFIEDAKSHSMKSVIENLDRALLVFHSPIDETVGIENARLIYDSAKHPKSFISLDGADHLLLQDPEDSEFVASMLSAWSKRYIEHEPNLQQEAA